MDCLSICLFDCPFEAPPMVVDHFPLFSYIFVIYV